jgi:hypothetical protein
LNPIFIVPKRPRKKPRLRGIYVFLRVKSLIDVFSVALHLEQEDKLMSNDKFFRLNEESAIKLNTTSNITFSSLRLLYHLLSIDPFGDRPLLFEEDKIMKIYKWSKRQLYAAKKILIEANLFEFVTTYSSSKTCVHFFRNLKGITLNSNESSSKMNESTITFSGNAVPKNGEPLPKNGEGLPKNGEPLPNLVEGYQKEVEAYQKEVEVHQKEDRVTENCQSQRLEANDSNGSTLSKTNSDLNRLNKTYSECVQTNSDSRARENLKVVNPKNKIHTHNEKTTVKSFSLEELEARKREMIAKVKSSSTQEQKESIEQSEKEIEFLKSQLPKFENLPVNNNHSVANEINEINAAATNNSTFMVTNGANTTVDIVSGEVVTSDVVTNIDKMTWKDFDWIDGLYQKYKPSRWMADYLPKMRGILDNLKLTLKDLNGDINELQKCLKNAFKRVDSNPKLWGASFEWTVRYENLQTLAWEYESELSLAPSKRLLDKKQEADFKKAEDERMVAYLRSCFPEQT